MDKLVIWFQTHYPDLVEDMRNCSHHSDSSLNPYHLEGDVWSHTLLCLSEAKDLSELMLFVILCHDIGKPMARKESNGKTSFKGHELISAFMTLPIAKKYGFSDKEIIKIFQLIAYHTSILKLLDNENCLTEVLDIHKGNPDLFLDLLPITKADGLGRIMEKYNDKLYYIEDYFSGTLDTMLFNKKEKKSQQSTLTCLIGLPGSGKSTYLKNNKVSPENIICRDDIIMQLAKTKDSSIISNPSDRLKKDCHKNIESLKSHLVSNKKDIYLDMTHLTDKDRHLSLKGIPRNYWFKAVIIINDLDSIKAINLSRDKKVSWSYIENLLKRSSLPLYNEFDEIEWVFKV